MNVDFSHEPSPCYQIMGKAGRADQPFDPRNWSWHDRVDTGQVRPPDEQSPTYSCTWLVPTGHNSYVVNRPYSDYVLTYQISNTSSSASFTVFPFGCKSSQAQGWMDFDILLLLQTSFLLTSWYTLSEAWSGVKWADLMVYNCAFSSKKISIDRVLLLFLLRVREALCPRRRLHSRPIEL